MKLRAATEAINRAYLGVCCFILLCSPWRILGLDHTLQEDSEAL